MDEQECNNIQVGKVYHTDNEVVLHEDTIDILFKHKNEVHHKLMDLRGIYLIDHVAIKIIDPANKITIFSISPSVEYNLIVKELWKSDYGFSKIYHNNNDFYLWETAYSKERFHELKYIKELKHGFKFGFNIAKKVNNFTFIYSFATRSSNQGLYEYYHDHVNELLILGDYGYRLIRNIYEQYCDPRFCTPSIISRQQITNKPYLRLIVNDAEK